MSYILDALKKADAERERGTVPGLHSQPLGQVEDDDDDSGDARKAMPPMVWLGAGVGLCLIAVLSWQLLLARKDEPAAAVASVPQAEQMPALPMQTREQPPAGQQGMGAQQQDMRPPVPQQPAQGTQAPPQGYAPPPRMPAQHPERPANEAREAREPHDMPPPVRNNNANSPGGTAAGERIPTANELPDDVRHSLPQLTIGGAMYSDTPANRMLIVNSQVFHEGDQPYQGLLLEEIKLKSAVFRYKGYRYAISY